MAVTQDCTETHFWPSMGLGTSMGSWLAAESAAMCPYHLRHLVLVDAVGIKPEVGEIAEVPMCSREEAASLQ